MPNPLERKNQAYPDLIAGRLRRRVCTGADEPAETDGDRNGVVSSSQAQL